MTEATTEVVEQPVEPAVVENALNPETVSADPPTTEQVADEPAEVVEDPKTEHGNKGKSPWYMRRIAEEADRARAAEEEAKNLKAMLERMNSSPPKEEPKSIPQDVDAIVNAKIAERDLQRDSSDILQAGIKDYGSQFNETVKLARALGIVSDDIVLDLAAVDKQNAHKILTSLTENPDHAELVARMNPRQRLAELTRLSMAVAQPKTEAKPAPTKQVSRAPAPPPPVEPTASKEIDWRSDKASEDEFQKGWEEMMARRNRVRR